MSQPINLIIVDDHPLIREGIKQILSIHPEIHIVAEGANGEDAVELSQTVPCDLLLLDINMPKLNGIEAVKRIRQTQSDLKIILLTVESDFYTLKEAVSLQVNGYLLKESAGDTLIDAIRHVLDGGNFIDQLLTKHIFTLMKNEVPITEPPLSTHLPFEHLSRRECDILYYISQGLSNKEIASKLFLSEKTIRNSSTVLFKKIQVKDRVQATIYALNHHLNDYMENETK